MSEWININDKSPNVGERILITDGNIVKEGYVRPDGDGMSDRLISANSLIRKLLIIPEYDCDNFPITLTIREVKNLIRNEPTAYNLDKVITKIENFCNDQCYLYCTKCCALEGSHESILDIVKGGGTDDDK